MVVGVAVSAVTVLATWVAAALDADATGFARWGAVTALAVVTLSPALRSVRWARARRWRRAVGYATVAAVLAAVVIGLIANAVAHGGAIVFRREGCTPVAATGDSLGWAQGRGPRVEEQACG